MLWEGCTPRFRGVEECELVEKVRWKAGRCDLRCMDMRRPISDSADDTSCCHSFSSCCREPTCNHVLKASSPVHIHPDPRLPEGSSATDSEKIA